MVTLFSCGLSRAFSILDVDDEDTAFWTTWIQGFSVVPFFMLHFCMVTNTGFALVLGAVAELPHTHGLYGYVTISSLLPL